MTFGAMAAWQAWLLLAGAAAVATGLFLIKLRPPRMLVPSLLLWRRVLDEARTLTLWERIRRAVSLAATILIALAIALAATRPGRGADRTSVSNGRLLLVLDSSWSMQARTRTGETRWERAVAEARRLVTAASGNPVALATTADGLVEGPTIDSALIESALDRIAPGGGYNASWPRLAETAAVHFLTDGASRQPLEPGVIVHSVFEPASNVAVTALELRPSLDPAHAADAYLEIANYSPSGQTLHVTMTRGTVTVFDRDLDAGPSELLRQVIPLAPGGDPAFRVRVSARDNALAVDDEAAAWIDRARPTSIAVVGTDTAWLRAALAQHSDVRATFVSPENYQPGQEDVSIFVNWAPPEPPGRPSLLFAPPADTDWLSRDGNDPATPAAAERLPRWQTPGVHPVVQGVDPFTLAIERARAYQAPSLVAVARSERGTPLVYVAESPDRRLVIVTFGPGESNLAGAPGFPVLLGNTLDWLTHPVSSTSAGAETTARHPGLIAAGPGVVTITDQRAEPVRLSRVDQMVVGMLRAPGLYTVEGGGARSTLAVNIADPQVSNLGRTTLTGSTTATQVAAGSSSQPWWVYCAAAAFVLALAEWWTWQRRITV